MRSLAEPVNFVSTHCTSYKHKRDNLNNVTDATNYSIKRLLALVNRETASN